MGAQHFNFVLKFPKLWIFTPPFSIFGRKCSYKRKIFRQGGGNCPSNNDDSLAILGTTDPPVDNGHPDNRSAAPDPVRTSTHFRVTVYQTPRVPRSNPHELQDRQDKKLYVWNIVTTSCGFAVQLVVQLIAAMETDLNRSCR